MPHLFLLFLLATAPQFQADDSANIQTAQSTFTSASNDKNPASSGSNGHGMDRNLEVSRTSDLTITAGLAFTPNRKATDTDSGGQVWNQESRTGPSTGLTFRTWLSHHSGLFGEVGYSNTNTRLANYDVNTWTMNRVTVDGGYTYRWMMGRFTPYVKVGCGAMIFISGMATNNTSAGLDDRMEGLAGSGLDYSFSRHLSLRLEYEGRLIRNSDFSDITWRPQRNWISEPRLGISYVFGHGR